MTLPIREEEKSIFPPSKPLINLYFLTNGLALSDEKLVITELSLFVFIIKNIFSWSEKLEFKLTLNILFTTIYL